MVFEGLKAYRWVDGSIAAFRPEQNARRLRASARRLVMPELPEELFLEAVDVLVRQDRDWVPHELGRSLYLRPLLIATERGFALRPAREYRFLLLASPMGSFFGSVARPVRVCVGRPRAARSRKPSPAARQR
ncbi:MAG TPA: aminotransferase class IV [Jiangellales bacterium]|nr:aminotransferase class IV [Jiangellales bacterium]